MYRLVIGTVPVADEIFPLGGRQGETVGLELRGGMLNGTRIAAATLYPLSGTRIMPARIAGAVLGPGEPQVQSRRPISTWNRCRLWSFQLTRRSASQSDRARHRRRRSRRSCSTDGLTHRGKRSVRGRDDTGTAAADPGGSFGIRVGARRDAASPGQERLGHRQCRRYKHSPAARPGQQAQALVLPDPSLELTIPGGTTEITLVIRDLENRGGIGFPYRIVVEPLLPDFELLANESQLSVPRGGTASTGVTIRRKGFSGPITVTVADSPPGISVRPGLIAAGQNTGALTLSAGADASFPPTPIKLVGRAQRTEGPFERLASKQVVYAQQNNVPMCSIDHFGLIAAPALALPVHFETPSTPIEVPHGFSATIPVKVARTKGADAALAITALPLPAGLAVPKYSITEKAAEGKVRVTAAVAAPLGTSTLVLQAKGKVGGAERVIDLPAITLNVVAPASLEIEAKPLEVKAGTTVELKGKINRKGSFDAPVTVKINGLPTGLKADPVTVAGKEANFVIKVVAEAKAPAATADTRVALAFQVEKKDYSVTPTPLAVKVAAGK